jgi:hypothetical protein
MPLREKKMKRIVAILLALLVVVLSASAACADDDSTKEKRAVDSQGLDVPITEHVDRRGSSGQLTVSLHARPYEIKQLNEGVDIRMKDFGSSLNPGEPKLPAKTFLIGLPPGAEVTSVQLVTEHHKEIPGTYQIVPAPPFAATSNESYTWRNRAIYTSEGPYPQQVYEYLGMTQLRKYKIARVQFTPLVYYPTAGKLLLYEQVTLRLEYQIVEDVTDELFADTGMDDIAAQSITNYDTIASHYAPSPMPSAQTSYDYVVITTSSLESSVSSLVSWKESLGYSVKVVNTTWISAQYSGSDLPEKIRNFLIDTYAEWGITYVLIVGSHSTIPMRVCWPNPGDSGSTTPTDYYYADLTGNWDSDGDGHYGEYGQDNAVDFTPEVYVGRIPVDNAQMVQSICTKTISFEQTENSGWKRRALLLGAIGNYANEDRTGYPKTDGATLSYELQTDMLDPHNYTYERMNEQGGVGQKSTYPYEHALTNSNVINGGYGWPSGYGIVNWFAHGSTTAAWRKVWSIDDGDNVPESKEISFSYFLSSSDTTALDDSKPAIVFSCACDNSDPSVSNNLGKSLLERGAVTFVGATQVSWYAVGWQDESWGGNAAIDYYFFEYLINQNQKAGQALYYSKVYYRDHFGWSGWGYAWWMNMFDFCLYGDPAVGMAQETPIVVTSCDSIGTERDQFALGDTVYVKAEGLEPNTDYKIWIQNDPVYKDDLLVLAENPSSAETPKYVRTDASGELAGQPIVIWTIPANEPLTYAKYDIVVNKGVNEENQMFNPREDGLDSASVAGFAAPVPELPTIFLFCAGLLTLTGYVLWKKRF